MGRQEEENKGRQEEENKGRQEEENKGRQEEENKGRQEEENKELARRLIRALSQADTEFVREHYSSDFKLWVTGSLPFSGTNDKAGALHSMPQVLGLFPDGIEFRIEAMTAEGERVAIEATGRGRTIRGDLYEQDTIF